MALRPGVQALLPASLSAGLASGYSVGVKPGDLAVRDNEHMKATDGKVILDSRSSWFHGVPR